MQPSSFSPTEAISFGWNTFKKQKKFWIIAAILFSVLGNSSADFNVGDILKNDSNTSKQVEQSVNPPPEQITDKPLPLVPGRVDQVLGISDMRDSGNYMGFIILFVIVAFIFAIPYIIAVTLISGAVQMGFLKFFLAAARNKTPTYETILSEVKLGKSFRFLAANLLYGLLVLVGLLLFIIPGIYFAVKYGLVGYNVVDKDATIGESFRLSAEATKGNKWNLLGLGMLILLINIAGIIALLYGLLVSIPISMLASAYVYNKLSSGKTV